MGLFCFCFVRESPEAQHKGLTHIHAPDAYFSTCLFERKALTFKAVNCSMT